MAVYTRPDKRFHRAHRKPNRRRKFQLRRRFFTRSALVVFVFIAGTYWTIDIAIRTPFLSINVITVDGHNRLSQGEVLALVASLQGRNMLIADLDVARSSLLTSGWVKNATLRRVLPSTIEITLKEREPVGLGRFGSRLYLVDPSGQIIDEFDPRFADMDLPIIDGLSTHPIHSDLQVDARRINLAVRLITDISEAGNLADRISQIDVADSHNAVVLLRGEPELIHLGEERFAERLQVYVDLEPSLRTQVPLVDYVDLRFDQRVYVRAAEQDVLAEAKEFSSWRQGQTEHMRNEE